MTLLEHPGSEKLFNWQFKPITEDTVVQYQYLGNPANDNANQQQRTALQCQVAGNHVNDN